MGRRFWIVEGERRGAALSFVMVGVGREAVGEGERRERDG